MTVPIAARGRAEETHPPIGRRLAVPTGDGAPPVMTHLIDEGPRRDTAIVLIHGASGNLRDFAFGLVGALARRHRVIAIDRPGHGHSERPRGPAWRPDLQASVMRRAVESLGVARVVLLGHSLGAASALAWAIAAPDRVAGLVSLAGVSHAWPGRAALRYDIAATPVIGPLAARLAGALATPERIAREIAQVFAPQSPPEGYLDYIGAHLALRPETFRANGLDVAHLKGFLAEQEKRYPNLPMPIEAIHGDADTIVPLSVHAAPLAERAPLGRLTRLAGVGHMPHHSHARPVLDALDRMVGAACP